jgi:hypothetical protein
MPDNPHPAWHLNIHCNTPIDHDYAQRHFDSNPAFDGCNALLEHGPDTPTRIDLAVHAPDLPAAVYDVYARITTLPGLTPDTISPGSDMTLDCAARLLTGITPASTIHNLADTLTPVTSGYGTGPHYDWTHITQALTDQGHTIPDPLPALAAAVTTIRESHQ